jgi:hypothetical protein
VKTEYIKQQFVDAFHLTISHTAKIRTGDIQQIAEIKTFLLRAGPSTVTQ